ncbi:MAG: UTP--glucose-1-phosphate uridylyltransferase, partial [Burkholderiaceae bacterium]|nr:UTP--glucose-1-phosphate uridylyltransferase [Burkholderiaceae bacterium]
ESFAVILADDLLDGQPAVLKQMVDLFAKQSASILAVEKIKPVQSKSYGVVAVQSQSAGIHTISGIIEKPESKDAPSNLGVVGRYILSSSIFKHIRNLKPGSGGEYQLTDAIAALLKEEPVIAYEYEGIRYDCGSKLGYLKATIEFALKHPELKHEFESYLKNR